ncbi:hydroperoxide isomerase ALOXE3-like [Mugil cephalus]|uniref:hydroperoxide isomerase ALOXE3-like n=1 Tax=Mugil cephalus TaxID=48193 RepID=UPI001FB697AB|nr:hydroperoxide isomerase ALOXE3-like [Mugil cephalus]
MAEYKLQVTTGNLEDAGTADRIYVTLFGTEGDSERTELDNVGIDFRTGTTGTYTIKSNSSLGKLLLIKVEKDPLLTLPEDEWYCSKIVATTPERDVILFPCYRWISRGELVELRGGKAVKVFEENHPLLIKHRETELAFKKSLYQWEIVDEKVPHKIHFNHISQLPAELRFSMSKNEEVEYSKRTIGRELFFKGLVGSTEQWENIEAIKTVFSSNKTTMSEYVADHWQEDEFFGYQYLNATNPNVIKRCLELPRNFPVMEEMVEPFLKRGSSLKKEMEKGNIFIRDQKIMDGIPTRKLKNGDPTYMTVGFCLFYMNPENKLMPIAIQLNQQPSDQNPIFLPSDLDTDWLLAKLFFKSSDVMEYEAVHHLMNTHFLAEVFAVATLRCFPVIHPLYKLLIPHFRYTLHINTVGRGSLFGPQGPLSLSSLGYDGLMELMGRHLSEMSYSSLCLPENITARGLESVPNFYYRDDGLKLWDIINRFVKSIVEYYYPSDNDVRQDTELQEWISEIFKHCFLGNKQSGIPASFNTVKELIKFVTVVIFTVTAQHAAVNNGQYDFHSWTPNGSLLLHKPPPTTKGQSTMETISETLPNVGETVTFVTMVWILADTYSDVVYLGAYAEERFDEPAPKQTIAKFQAELSHLSEAIAARNAKLGMPYTYLDPTQIENSVAI